jgi:hypothetical protein
MKPNQRDGGSWVHAIITSTQSVRLSGLFRYLVIFRCDRHPKNGDLCYNPAQPHLNGNLLVTSTESGSVTQGTWHWHHCIYEPSKLRRRRKISR